jgi:hypothetical protein
MKILQKMALLCAIYTISNYAQAHYGPRGVLGGTITSATVDQNGLIIVGTPQAGVFISTNAAIAGWRTRSVGLKSGKITAVHSTGKDLFAATADSGIYIFNGSAGGNDLFWNPRNNGLSNTSINCLGSIDTNTLFAGSTSGLFQSTDAGANWNAVNNPFFNNRSITAIVKGGNRIFVATATNGIYMTENGNDWLELNQSAMQISGIKNLTYNHNSKKLMTLSTDGLFIIENADTVTTSPTIINGGSGAPPIHRINHISNNATHWYLASDDGIMRYHVDSAVNWNAFNMGLPTMQTNVILALDTLLIAGTNKLGVFRTNPININWIAANSGTHGISNIAVTSVAGLGDSIVVTASERGILLSTNFGNTPSIRNNGLIDSLNVNDVEFAGNYLIAATTNNGVFWSTDLGHNWVAINNGLATMNISRIYSSFDNKYVIDGNGVIYRSHIDSTNWSNYSNGIAGTHKVTAMAFYGEWLYAATLSGGVYRKRFADNNWQQINTGLSNLNVTAITVSANQIFAGTNGNGVFVRNIDVESWQPTSPIQIDHFNDVPINPNNIQYLTSFAGYAIVSYRGGVAATVNGGNSWIRGGHQFHLPSFTDINKISFINTRIKVTTNHNSMMSNSLAEFALIDTILTASQVAVNAPAVGLKNYQTITSNINWTISSNAPWVNISVDSGFRNANIIMTINPNPDSIARTAIITLSGGSIVRTITINQLGVLDTATSLQQIVDINKLVRIYPNPSNGIIKIDTDNDVQIERVRINDINGKMLIEKTNQFSEINTGLSQGIYFIHIESKTGISTKKFIIQ